MATVTRSTRIRQLKKTVKYTAREFEEIIQQLQDIVQVHDTSGKFWNDFFASNIGQMLMDMIAVEGTKNTYIANQIALEIFRGTARRRRSMLYHADMAGYEPRGRMDTALDIQAVELPTVSGNSGELLVFEAGTAVSIGGLTFETVSEQRYLITESLLDESASPKKIPYTSPEKVTFTVRHSIESDDDFTYTSDPAITYTTTNEDVIDGSWTVTVGEGVSSREWTDVSTLDTIQSLFFAGPDDEVYAASYLADGRIEIKFGDGVRGKQPANNTPITITYRTGGGAEGASVLPNTMGGQTVQALFGTAGEQVARIPFNNPNALTTAGRDEETLEEMRENIGLWIRTLDKAISPEDYETLASQFEDDVNGTGAVSRAKVMLERSGYTANWVYLYVWSQAEVPVTWTINGITESGDDTTITGFEASNSALMEALYRYLHKRRVATVQVCIQPGQVNYIDINLGTVVCDQYVDTGEVTTAIRTAVESFFSGTKIQPGKAFRLSDFYRVIDAISGVDHFTIQSPTTDVTPLETQIVMLRSLTMHVVNTPLQEFSIGQCELDTSDALD
jgi:hypothetical protein